MALVSLKIIKIVYTHWWILGFLYWIIILNNHFLSLFSLILIN